MTLMYQDSSQRRKSKEIGNYFDISLVDLKNASTIDDFSPFGKGMYLSTCRSAISIALQDCFVKSKVALLPGFTCHAVVDPFVKNGFEVIPYSIENNLAINLLDLCRKVKEYNPGVLLIQDYFGFDSNNDLRRQGLLEQLQKNGVVIINDQTQSMFSSYETLTANYYLGSIRKWMGIPDGAFLKGVSNKGVFVTDRELEKAKVYAMVYKHKYLFDDEGTKDCLLTNYRHAESILDSREKPYAISYTTRGLYNCYNLDNFKCRRQENGKILLSGLSKVLQLECPFKEIQDFEVPFYIPVMVKKNRKNFQTYLAQNNVFATVIWRCPNNFENLISIDTRNVYNQILCIPCDQRYSEEDMNYICELVKEFNWENEE